MDRTPIPGRELPGEERRAGAGADVLLRRVVVVEGARTAALVDALAGNGISARVVRATALETVIAGLIVFESGAVTAVTAAIQSLRRRHAPFASICLADDAALVEGLLPDVADVVLPASASAAVLASQLRALARLLALEPPSDEPEIIAARGITIDLERREVRAGGRPVALTPTEFRIVAQLARRPGRVVSHGEIFHEVYGQTTSEQEAKDILKVHIWRLRAKLAKAVPENNIIVNVRGFGYMLERRGSRDRRARPVLPPS